MNAIGHLAKKHYVRLDEDTLHSVMDTLEEAMAESVSNSEAFDLMDATTRPYGGDEHIREVVRLTGGKVNAIPARTRVMDVLTAALKPPTPEQVANWCKGVQS